MREIILEKRYPHSREEDITDAFMRGYEKGKADRPKGEWIEHKWKEYNEELMMSFPCHNYECSECSFHAHEPTNYCPNCGADMRGDNNETD